MKLRIDPLTFGLALAGALVAGWLGHGIKDWFDLVRYSGWSF